MTMVEPGIVTIDPERVIVVPGAVIVVVITDPGRVASTVVADSGRVRVLAVAGSVAIGPLSVETMSVGRAGRVLDMTMVEPGIVTTDPERVIVVAGTVVVVVITDPERVVSTVMVDAGSVTTVVAVVGSVTVGPLSVETMTVERVVVMVVVTK